MNAERQIVPGISLSASGQATVDPAVADVLFDLALQLEEPTNLPVDVEHVLAAIVLAAQNGGLKADTALRADDPELIDLLAAHVNIVFAEYGGNVGEDE